MNRDFFRGEQAVREAYPDPREAKDLRYEDVKLKSPMKVGVARRFSKSGKRGRHLQD